MGHQDSFSIVGCIEDIINVFNDNMDMVAIFELLIIITLVIILFSKVNSLKDKNNNLEERLFIEHKERKKEQQDYYNQKTALENKLRIANGTNNFNLGNNPPKKLLFSSNPEADKLDNPNPDQNASVPQLSSLKDAEVKDKREFRYMEPAIGGKFFKSKVSEEKASFRTWVEGDVRKFEFCGNIANALANLNATFDDSCDYEGKQNGATEIINVEPGILLEDFSIMTKAKIRLQ